MGILDELLDGAGQNSDVAQVQNLSDKERCRYDLVEFARTYLSSGDMDELCDFHYDIAKQLQYIALTKNESTNTCYQCSRGHGKSWWASYAFELWVIAYKHLRNVLIVTNETSLARQFVMDIKQFIEENEKFREDFGDLVGDVWSQDKIICSNGVSVVAKSSGTSLRGVKVNTIRPEVLILDDILSEENSGTTEQRKKLYDWYTRVLIKCGSKYSHIFCVGTPQNDQDLLSLMSNSPQFSDFKNKRYPAVLKFSESPLWDQWIDIRNDLSNPNRIEDADRFYFEHREEMTEGTQVLWDRYPDSYLQMMKEKQRLGEAWSTEMMCEPVDELSREFPEEWLESCLYEIGEMPEITDVFVGIDASATANRNSDDASIVVVGKGDNGYYYVLDVFTQKATVPMLADQMLVFAAQYGSKIRRVAIEKVVFQAVALQEGVEKKLIECGYHIQFDPIPVQGLGKKEVKLRSLILPVRNKWIKMRKDQKKLLNEFRRFPRGKDNTLDALWLAIHGLLNNANTSFSFTSLATSVSSIGSSLNIFKRR